MNNRYKMRLQTPMKYLNSNHPTCMYVFHFSSLLLKFLQETAASIVFEWHIGTRSESTQQQNRTQKWFYYFVPSFKFRLLFVISSESH